MKPFELPLSLEQEELRGLARTVAEIEWLLLVLVLLYQAFGGPQQEGRIAISMAMFFFSAAILTFRYTNLYRTESRWKIAIETWIMIAFVTWSAWYTGKLQSPLLNCYLLVIITSALTLGKWNTAGQLIVIGLAFLVLGYGASDNWLTLSNIGSVAVQFAPFILVGYVTTMFSADIRYGLSKMRALSETDELTGLLNRRAFAVAAARAFAHCTRYNRPLSMLMIDSDGLKQINDSHGHGAGDELLCLLAHSIQNELRATDILARQGGDEFIALLPETAAVSAREVAERVRQAIENARTAGGGMVKTTVSIGIATYPEDGRLLDTLRNNADSALYRAKSEGRNRVVEYSSKQAATA